MTSKLNLKVIAATALLCVLAVPRDASAQFPGPGPIDGTWNGIYSYTTTIYDNGNNQPPDVFSGSGAASLNITNDGGGLAFYMTMTGSFPGAETIQVGGFLSPEDAFGPTSATASLLPFGGPGQESFGNFAVTYDSIQPNGDIITGNDAAIADLTYFVLGEQDMFTFATFTTVPEPSSWVLAAVAIAVFTTVSWVRGVR
jgi:hypothetical protein